MMISHTDNTDKGDQMESCQKKRKRGIITASTSATRYELIRKSIEEIGMKTLQEEKSDSHSYLVWSDSAVQPDRVQELKSYQHINHFCGMAEICRKDFLARNMAKMSRTCPDEYNFIPRTWILPSEYNLLVLHWKDLRKRNRKPVTFIMKPANGAMGNGIHLFRNPERIAPRENMIVQEYLDRPFLLDDYKIDLRLYVLITHCDPLRAFLYRDGLVRLGTEKYASPSEGNVDSLYMHLTNYSVNKYSEKFERHSDVDRGSKRSVKSLMNYLHGAGYDTTVLWGNIVDLVVKTLIVASPHILHGYRMSRPGHHPHADSVCFEILGFDIFLDRKLKPWLLEVNRSPSFGTDERVDYDIKSGVIKEALQLLNIRPSDKLRHIVQQKKEAQQRLLKPSHKRVVNSSGLSNAAKRRIILQRRKEELNEKLLWTRKVAEREEYENRRMNNYMRIFPSVDKRKQERYLNLLQESLCLFLKSRSAPFQKNIIDQYTLEQEEEILNMLEQCEVEENGGNCQRPKVLSSMPVISSPLSSRRNNKTRPFSASEVLSDSSMSYEDTDKRRIENTEQRTVSKRSPEAEKATKLVREGTRKSRFSASSRIRSAGHKQSGDGSSLLNRPLTSQGSARNRWKNEKKSTDPWTENLGQENDTHIQDFTRTSNRHGAFVQSYINTYNDAGRTTKIYSRTQFQAEKQASDLKFLTAKATQEREIELCSKTLTRLNITQIKFPGKSEAAAEKLLSDIIKSWKFHKPLVAAYWLVKLDTLKRQKVIDIVRGTVRAAVQRTWIVADVESLKIMRIFNRLFNRMHANHGQGLWSCFSAASNSWETMFCKSSEAISEYEMDCCRRIVQLCKDCLLIVYQFANDAQNFSVKYVPSDNKQMIVNLNPHSVVGSQKPEKLSTVAKVQDKKSDGVPYAVPRSSQLGQFPISEPSNRISSSDQVPNSTNFEHMTAESKKGNMFDELHSISTLPMDNIPRRFTRSLRGTTVSGPSNQAMQQTHNTTLLSFLQQSKERIK